jgi:hypothetical protein
VVSSKLISIPSGSNNSVLIGKLLKMKNEPVVSYNHMQDDEVLGSKKERISYSLYVLLVIDAILISAISVFVAKIIF